MARPEDTTFEAVGVSDERMHGTPCVIVAGASAMEQEAIRLLMNNLGMGDVGMVALTADILDVPLMTISQLPAGTGVGQEAKLPRAVITSGLTERQFNAFLKGYRALELPRPIMAVLTPTSAQWTAKALLIELLNEQKALREAAAKDNRS